MRNVVVETNAGRPKRAGLMSAPGRGSWRHRGGIGVASEWHRGDIDRSGIGVTGLRYTGPRKTAILTQYLLPAEKLQNREGHVVPCPKAAPLPLFPADRGGSEEKPTSEAHQGAEASCPQLPFYFRVELEQRPLFAQ